MTPPQPPDPKSLGAIYAEVLDGLLPAGGPKGKNSRARRRSIREAAKGEPSFAKHFAIASLRPLTAPSIVEAINAAEMMIFGQIIKPISPAEVYNPSVRHGRSIAKNSFNSWIVDDPWNPYNRVTPKGKTP